MVLTILHHYLFWHYSRAYLQFFHVWTNLMWFVVRFFSLTELLGSLFSPWKRMVEERKKAWDVEEFFSSLVINILSRIIGAMVRIIVLSLGTIVLTVVFVGGLVVYLVWTVAPALIVFLIILGGIYIVQ